MEEGRLVSITSVDTNHQFSNAKILTVDELRQSFAARKWIQYLE